MDPYKVLGIDQGASLDEIRRAYRKQAAKYHPDAGGEVWVFQQIQDAYEELTGKRKKKKSKSQAKSTQPEQQPQPEPTKPFTEKPFSEQPFGFEFQKEEPRAGYTQWQPNSWTGKSANRFRSRTNRWLLGVGAAGLILGLIALGVLIGRGSGRKNGESTAQASEHPLGQLLSPRTSGSVKDVSSTSDAASQANPPTSPTISLPTPVLSVTFDEEASTTSPAISEKLVSLVLGIVGNGADFTNNSSATFSSTLPIGNSPRTLSVWLKVGHSENFRNYHIVSYGKLNAKGVFGLMIGQNTVRFFDHLDGLNSEVVVDDAWHHHCLTFDGSELVYFFDGDAVARGTRDLATELGPLTIGKLDSHSRLALKACSTNWSYSPRHFRPNKSRYFTYLDARENTGRNSVPSTVCRHEKRLTKTSRFRPILLPNYPPREFSHGKFHWLKGILGLKWTKCPTSHNWQTKEAVRQHLDSDSTRL